MQTERRHVEAAMAEFREMGSTPFFSKYTGGFPPKTHWFEQDGFRYPLKAIWTVARRLAGSSERGHPTYARRYLAALGYNVTLQIADDGTVDELDFQVREGERAKRETTFLTRNKGVVDAAKKAFNGNCEGCGDNLEAKYGSLARGFVEAHHKYPLAGADDVGVTTKVSDLALLCANCHRMVHRKSPCLTIEELQSILRAR